MMKFTFCNRIGLAIFAFLFFTILLKAQDAAIYAKGNTHITAVGEFLMYNNSYSASSVLGIRLTANRFIIDRLYAGPSISYSSSYFGTGRRIFSGPNSSSIFSRSSRILLGPTVGYVFGKDGAALNPYVQSTFEIGFFNSRYEDGHHGGTSYRIKNAFSYEARFGGGLLIPLAKSIALNMEAGYRVFTVQYPSLFENRRDVFNHFYFGIGFTGLF